MFNNVPIPKPQAKAETLEEYNNPTDTPNIFPHVCVAMDTRFTSPVLLDAIL